VKSPASERSTAEADGEKRKGVARIRFANASVHLAEVHWYEATSLGRKEFKIKNLIDD
jgi:hypothetical protein